MFGQVGCLVMMDCWTSWVVWSVGLYDQVDCRLVGLIGQVDIHLHRIGQLGCLVYWTVWSNG